MTKTEFKRRINEAEKRLKNKSPWYTGFEYDGVCGVLGVVFGMGDYIPASYLFQESMQPHIKGYRGLYWLGDRTKENLGKRQIALRLFEQYMLSEQLYEVL